MVNDESSPPPFPASNAGPSSRVRFSLASIMFLMTGVSLVLGLVRAIPIPDEFRQVLLIFGSLWAVVGLIAAGPASFRYLELRRQTQAREAKLRAWVNEKRRQAREATSATLPPASEATTQPPATPHDK